MPYRLLLPATLDLVPADVHEALVAFGATPLADRGCAWQLPEGGAPGVRAEAAPVIIRLLPRKGIQINPGEPSFRIPKGTHRAVEVITPAEEPPAADRQRVHDCAIAVAETLKLGVLNPYRGVYYESADAYRAGMSETGDVDVPQVQRWSGSTHRRNSGRTSPGDGMGAEGAGHRNHAVPVFRAEKPRGLGRLTHWLRGTRRYRLAVPADAPSAYADTLVRQMQSALPVARVHYEPRRRSIVIDAPRTPLVTRTVHELMQRYGEAPPNALKPNPAAAC